jgi:hypothetical protein
VLQFVGGFIVGLLTVAVLLLLKRIAGTKGDGNNHLAQLEELSKLTGGLAHEIRKKLTGSSRYSKAFYVTLTEPNCSCQVSTSMSLSAT